MNNQIKTLSIINILSQCDDIFDPKRGSLTTLAKLLDSCWIYAKNNGYSDNKAEEWLVEVLGGRVSMRESAVGFKIGKNGKLEVLDNNGKIVGLQG